MSKKISELFTYSTSSSTADWQKIINDQHCMYLGKRCDKRRKSQPEIAIGTCSVGYGASEPQDIIICPHRFLERRQIFLDSVHLLTLHEPGNELHIISEQSIPGGSVDYFLVSAYNGKVVDFIGIEIQALDTTGTAWPERQKFIASVILDPISDYRSDKSYGMNWKMTAKTTLVQLHHKVETFENIGKHLVLVLQNSLFDYMKREFSFGHLVNARLGDSMHFHAYGFTQANDRYRISLTERQSTDSAGIAKCLGIRASPFVELEIILSALEKSISEDTLLTL